MQLLGCFCPDVVDQQTAIDKITHHCHSQSHGMPLAWQKMSFCEALYATPSLAIENKGLTTI